MSGPRRSRAHSPVIPVALLLIASAFLLALLAAHVDPPRYGPRPAGTAAVDRPSVLPTQEPPEGPAVSEPALPRPLREVGSLVLGLYLLFVAAALLALGAFLVRALADRSRGRRRAEPGARDVPGRDLDPTVVAQRMAEAATAGLDDLAAEGPVRDAIIACWQRLRAAAAEAGLPAVASDTPEEAIARVLRAGAVSAAAAAPLSSLAGLYREARFSDHDMSRGDVWVARQCLQAIVAELRPEASDAR